MKGIGGIAALSMSNATVAQAQEVLESPLPTDPHTRDTYRAIVDAVVPRTPQLEEELGEEHVPGGLEVELEKFIIWDFNHFQEVRSEMLTEKTEAPAAKMPLSLFETGLDLTGGESPLAALVERARLDDLTTLDGLDALDGLGDLGGLDGLDAADVNDLDSSLELTDGISETLEFGPVDSFDLSFADVDPGAEGIAEFRRTVTVDGQRHQRVLQNYPYAAVFPFAFDLVAAEFLARGRNEDQPSPNPEFAGGGTFTRLSRQDRLRCLWTIVDGSVIDRLDTLLSPMVPDVGILKYVVMAVNGLHGFGYYTEWSGLGETKTNTPTEREMQVAPDEVQSRQQTDYPGPAPGYAADWRHAVPGGFDDPDVDELDLSDDLAGDDYIDGIGGDS